MKHSRSDYNRFQDPAGHPDVHFYELVQKLADAYDGDDELALLGVVVDFFGARTEDAKPKIAAARAFAARAILSPGASPIGADEPVFLIRGQDAAAVEAVEAYAWVAEARGGTGIAVVARRWAGEIRRWQEVHGSKVPDLPGSGSAT